MSDSDLSAVIEDYLKRIWVLSQQPEFSDVSYVNLGDLSTAMDVSAGTVTTMMKRIAKLGFIRYEPYKGSS